MLGLAFRLRTSVGEHQPPSYGDWFLAILNRCDLKLYCGVSKMTTTENFLISN